MNWKNHYRKALTFSYDDGNEQDRKLLEILNRYGMKATFNVNTGLNHDCGTWVYRNVLEVHWQSVRNSMPVMKWLSMVFTTTI